MKNSVEDNGFFNNQRCRRSANIVVNALNRLNNEYNHYKLIAEMDFGFWRYFFSQPQFYAGGQTLLQIFPSKPRSTPTMQYNNRYVFNELNKINIIRNRIAHHEPVCFEFGNSTIDTTYAQNRYLLIKELFDWMQIDEASLLYGIDHVSKIIKKINDLK